ncbi:MAG: SprB repeat-containing protein [Crocinitomicaceae bacterium]|nr:SprB repeat-containing protein [Crocinitomicaceae bacterium]
MKGKLLIAMSFTLIVMSSSAQFWKYSNPEKLKGTVNTVESEENIPVFSNDSSILYFVRSFNDANKGGVNDQDIWFSKREADGSYHDSKRVKGLNNKFNNAVLGLSEDGTSMYLLGAYEGKKDQVKGLAVSKNVNGKWSAPETITIPTLDIDGDFYGFHVNDKEDVIIISYRGENSLGEEDLYVSTKSGSSWSAPIHMGSTINSIGFEISPFLSSSQDTLFFSSNGFGGEGDADIFYSVKKGSWTDWSEPKNLGNIINSPKFDAYYVHLNDRAYWSSNKGGEFSDIYTVEIIPIPPLSVQAVGTNVTVYRGADGSIDCTPIGGIAPFTYEWSNGAIKEDPSGLVKGDYTVKVTDSVGQVASITVSLDEPPMELDPVIAKSYENVSFKHNFGYNKNKLKTSRGDLRRFVKSIEKQLKNGRESITIKVKSSASKVPTRTYSSNDKLAALRAENIKYDMVAYFKKKYSTKVTVVVDEVVVGGPDYANDAGNKEKYIPYQFVEMFTE